MPPQLRTMTKVFFFQQGNNYGIDYILGLWGWDDRTGMELRFFVTSLASIQLVLCSNHGLFSHHVSNWECER